MGKKRESQHLVSLSKTWIPLIHDPLHVICLLNLFEFTI